ncbi:VOC family protein [Wenxinia marina]|uniref:VOC family protein n=1 Tax=Wenxinia marina TaxID=390641 RepID=UPI0012FCA0AB|nr:VOC family protein [Wenxinia marina]GGL58326.1 hypothetical protein GCM10011392_10950 [Wenxinia marina]
MTEIDHIFVFPSDIERLRHRLDTAGLVRSFEREHPGQGTANVCYCFDNMYLELLWVADAAARLNPAVARTALIERGTGETSACPVGIAWRDGPGRPLDLDLELYGTLPPRRDLNSRGNRKRESAGAVSFSLARDIPAIAVE